MRNAEFVLHRLVLDQVTSQFPLPNHGVRLKARARGSGAGGVTVIIGRDALAACLPAVEHLTLADLDAAWPTLQAAAGRRYRDGRYDLFAERAGDMPRPRVVISRADVVDQVLPSRPPAERRGEARTEGAGAR